MSIFGRIKDKIFGKKAEAAAPAPAIAAVAQQAPAVPLNPEPATDEPAAISEVDVEALLAAMPEAGSLNWRASIVDLLKLIDIDASFDNRKELATELGDTNYSGSAEDNIALHKAVMRELAANGGKVPADLID